MNPSLSELCFALAQAKSRPPSAQAFKAVFKPPAYCFLYAAIHPETGILILNVCFELNMPVGF